MISQKERLQNITLKKRQNHDKKYTELEQLNHEVAAIAGWAGIKHLDTSRNQEIQPKKKLFVGNNKVHPDLGKLVPNYVGSIDAIAYALFELRILWRISQYEDYCDAELIDCDDNQLLPLEKSAETPAIALCKLLVAIQATRKVNP